MSNVPVAEWWIRRMCRWIDLTRRENSTACLPYSVFRPHASRAACVSWQAVCLERGRQSGRQDPSLQVPSYGVRCAALQLWRAGRLLLLLLLDRAAVAY